MEWDALQYLTFGDFRTRPAADLAARVASRRPRSVVDIGCGPGNSTAVLAAVFPGADIEGIDNSPGMIAKARASCPAMRFRLCDAAALAGTYDLLFSNACLQWIPGHETLIPFLMGRLNAGGALSVQIPMNGDEPLFRIIEETAAEPQWGLDGAALAHNATLRPSDYADILAGCSSAYDMWETKYYHPLPDHRALVAWVKGTRLRPYLEHLGARAAAFEAEITEKAERVYPVGRDGKVTLGFRRFFFVAEK